MLPLPPRYTRTDTLIPYTTLCRSQYRADLRNHGGLTQIHRVALDQHARTQGADGGDVQLAQTREHCRMGVAPVRRLPAHVLNRSEEHTSELQSLMRISYAVFCLKQKIVTASLHPISAVRNDD